MPGAYSYHWLRDDGLIPDEETYRREARRRLRDFTERNVESISLGAIRGRRVPAGEHGVESARDAGDGNTHAPLHRLDQITGAPHPTELGRASESVFQLALATSRSRDDELLDSRWHTSSTVREHREHIPGSEHTETIILVGKKPYERQLQLPALVAAAVGASDGELT